MAAEHAPEPTNNATPASLVDLRSRYPNVRGPIVVALHVLLQDPGVSLDDAKAKAAAMGTRITAASVSAARRLISKMDVVAPARAAAPAATTVPTRPARRPRAAEATPDDEALIRAVVGKVRAQGDAQADMLRASIRKAIELLTTALA